MSAKNTPRPGTSVSSQAQPGQVHPEQKTKTDDDDQAERQIDIAVIVETNRLCDAPDDKDPHNDDRDHYQPGQPPLGTSHSTLKAEKQRQFHTRLSP
jgi:hypothetical protein